MAKATPEQKKRLRQLFFEVDPAGGNADAVEAIERFEEMMQQYENKLASLDKFFQSFKKEADDMLSKMQGKMTIQMGEIDRRHEKTLKEYKGDFEKKHTALEKETKESRDRFNQIIKEVQGEVRIAYSKMGGATKPLSIFLNGVATSIRNSDLNFVTGSNVTLTVSDDPIHAYADLTISSSGGGGSGGANVDMEIPSGTVNGINTVFTVANVPDWIEVSGQEMVSKTQDSGNYGYTVTGSAPYTITFVNPPTQNPHSWYSTISEGEVNVDLFTGDGSTTTFTATHTVNTDVLAIVANQPQTEGESADYTVSGNDIIFNYTPPNGAAIKWIYE